MFRITFKNKIYKIKKDKLIYVLTKLNNKNIKESEIENLLKKYNLLDEHFLKNINKI